MRIYDEPTMNVRAQAVDVPNGTLLGKERVRIINTVRIMTGDEARAMRVRAALGTGHAFTLGDQWGVDAAGWASEKEAYEAGCSAAIAGWNPPAGEASR